MKYLPQYEGSFRSTDLKTSTFKIQYQLFWECNCSALRNGSITYPECLFLVILISTQSILKPYPKKVQYELHLE